MSLTKWSRGSWRQTPVVPIITTMPLETTRTVPPHRSDTVQKLLWRSQHSWPGAKPATRGGDGPQRIELLPSQVHLFSQEWLVVCVFRRRKRDKAEQSRRERLWMDDRWSFLGYTEPWPSGGCTEERDLWKCMGQSHVSMLCLETFRDSLGLYHNVFSVADKCWHSAYGLH